MLQLDFLELYQVQFCKLLNGFVYHNFCTFRLKA